MRTNLKYRAIILIILIIMFSLLSCREEEYDLKDIKEKIEQELYKKYKKEFVVDRIGLRTAGEKKFYQARIYPRTYIGTTRENDPYYHGTASIDILDNGTLGGVGDSYPLVNLKLSIDEYITPAAEKIFGERILMNIAAHFKKREAGSKTFWGFKVSGFEEAKNLITEDPDNRMIELKLDLYIFDRLDSITEKEERKKQIIEFIDYLKSEGLYRYLEFGVIFMDERVLTPGYHEFNNRLKNSEMVKVEVDGEIISLPALDMRKDMSEELQKQFDNISEDELIINMNNIKRSDLIYNGLNRNNAQASFYLYSPGIIKLKYKTAFEKGILTEKKYDSVDDINIEFEREYIYIN